MEENYKYKNGSLMYDIMEYMMKKYRENHSALYYLKVFDKGKENTHMGIGTWTENPIRDVILFHARYYCKYDPTTPMEWWGFTEDEIFDIRCNAKPIPANQQFIK